MLRCLILLASYVLVALCGGSAPDPYPLLYGGSFGHKVAASPDPLAAYTWDCNALGDARFAYQIYYDAPVNATGMPVSAFTDLHSLIDGSLLGARVHGNGVITLRFAAEGPSWLEFESPDLAVAQRNGATISFTISENRFPGADETAVPKLYRGGIGPNNGTTIDTYRLELNAQLYEGIRYAFLTVSGMAQAPPWTITATPNGPSPSGMRSSPNWRASLP